MSKLKTTLFLLALCGGAQSVALAAAAPAPAAAAPISPAKQELLKQLLALWNIDDLGPAMLQVPVVDGINQARAMLQERVQPDKRDAAMGDIVAASRKFMDEAAPITRASADKLIPSTIEPILAANFSEDELRQLLAILQSPIKKKFEELVPAMKKTLGEGVAADTRPVIDPKLKALNEAIGLRLRAALAAPAAAAAPATP